MFGVGRALARFAYGQLSGMLSFAHIVLIGSSAGFTNEAPSLDKPVLAMRNNTERTEAVEAGIWH